MRLPHLAAVAVMLTMTAPASAVEFSKEGNVWQVCISHDEVVTLKKAGAAALAIPDPTVTKVVGFAVALVTLMDEIGGQKGVCIVGTFSSDHVVITPKGSSPFKEFVAVGKEAGKTWTNVLETAQKAGGDVSDEWKRFTSRVLPGKKNKKRNLTYGRVVTIVVRPTLSPENYGERFTLVSVGDGGKVAVHSYAGYLQHLAENQDQARFDAQAIGDQEKWEVVKNDDGTFSFKSFNGKFLTWTETPKKLEVVVRGGPVDNNRKFHIVPNDDGTVGIYRHDGNPRTHCWVTAHQWEGDVAYIFQTADR